MPEQPGYETVKSGSAQRNAACRARENGGHKLANRHKPACKGNPRPRGNDKDNEVFQRLDADFVEMPRLFVQFQAFVAVTLNQVVYPQHDFGIYGLRARIAAPQPPCDGGPPKQPEGGYNHQARQIKHIGGFQHHAEQVKMALFDVEQHGLPPVPHNPRHAVEKKLGSDNHQHAQVGKFADGALGMDAFAAVKLDDLLFDCGLGGGFGSGLRGFRLPLWVGWHGCVSFWVFFGFV